MSTDTIKILIDLDSLFDIRQGILSKLVDNNTLKDIVTSEEYIFRNIDRFSNIDVVKYNEVNNNRDKSIISNSIIAYMFNILKSKIANIEKRNAYHNENKASELLINIYPFTLTEKEQADLVDVLFVKLNTNIFINIVSYSIKQLSPLFLKNNNIIASYIYNSKDWLDFHSKDLDKNKSPDTSIYFPSIVYKELSKDELKQLSKLGFNDIFSFTEFLFSPYIVINFLPVIFYSNILTASAYINKYNIDIKDKTLSELFEDENEVNNGNTS